MVFHFGYRFLPLWLLLAVLFMKFGYKAFWNLATLDWQYSSRLRTVVPLLVLFH